VIGTVLKDTYRIERLLGQGSMGGVYEASHTRLSRRFAIKVLIPEIAARSEALVRFRREAEITSAIGHPHIVEIIDFDHMPDGEPYIVMELLEGEDLDARILRNVRLDLREVSTVMRQTSSALQAAHGKGVIHRDLKPKNIFLCQRGERDNFVKLLDFGISKVLGHGGRQTRDQALMGSPFYMAPEQAEQRAADADVRTDVYAMGTILYEMLTGSPPFKAENIPALLYAIVHNDPPPLRSERPDLPEAVEQVVTKAMRKRPEDRFSSMDELWRVFAGAVELDAGVVFDEPTEDRGSLWNGDLADGLGERHDTAVTDKTKGEWPPVAAADGASRPKRTTEPRWPGMEREEVIVAPVPSSVPPAEDPEPLLVTGDEAPTSIWQSNMALPPVANAFRSDSEELPFSGSIDVKSDKEPGRHAPLPLADITSSTRVPAAPGARLLRTRNIVMILICFAITGGVGVTVGLIEKSRRRAREPIVRALALSPAADAAVAVPDQKVARPPPDASVTSDAERRGAARPSSTLHLFARAGGRPVNAEVLIDGRRYGRTPLVVSHIAPGRHRLVARRAGLRTRRLGLTLAVGEATKIVLDLEVAGLDGGPRAPGSDPGPRP
jgi:serine/threonine protein kinase